MITDHGRITVVSIVMLIVSSVCFLAAQDDKSQDDKAQGARSPDNRKEKPYGLIFGTAYGPDDRPLYGVRVKIHPLGKNRPTWDLLSDHHGEFAQRVPKGPGDYVVNGEVVVAPVENGKPQASKKKRLRGEAKVHIEDQERRDFGLHLAE